MEGLDKSLADFNVQVFESLESTQTYAKQLVQKDPLFKGVILAHQLKGAYGRFGKPFYAPPGGIYMTFVLPDFPVAMSHITMYIAICYARTIKKMTGIDISVKWVNDLFINRKKIAGILTELVQINNQPVYIIGVGLNFHNEKANIPDDLQNIITALYMDAEPTITKDQLTVELINIIMLNTHMTNDQILLEYKKSLFILGEKIQVVNGDISYMATAIDLDNMGHLILQDENGDQKTMIAGEISIRI